MRSSAWLASALLLCAGCLSNADPGGTPLGDSAPADTSGDAPADTASSDADAAGCESSVVATDAGDAEAGPSCTHSGPGWTVTRTDFPCCTGAAGCCIGKWSSGTTPESVAAEAVACPAGWACVPSSEPALPTPYQYVPRVTCVPAATCTTACGAVACGGGLTCTADGTCMESRDFPGY